MTPQSRIEAASHREDSRELLAARADQRSGLDSIEQALEDEWSGGWEEVGNRPDVLEIKVKYVHETSLWVVRVSGGLLRLDVESGPEFELELNDLILDISSPRDAKLGAQRIYAQPLGVENVTAFRSAAHHHGAGGRVTFCMASMVSD